MKNYYKILGVLRTSHLSEIRKAYRKKAIELYPHKNSSTKAAEEFIELCEAYSVLKHVSSKVRYDKLYDHAILYESVKNEARYDSRETARKDFVNNRAEKGRSKGNAYSKASLDKFKKKKSRWAFFDGISRVFEFVGILFEAFV